MIRENQGSKQGRGHNDHCSAELGTGGRRSTLRWLLPFSARVHLPHSTRHQLPSSLRNTTSFQCPSAILHRSRRVVHLPSNSDSRVSTLIPSLSFSDVFVCRHSPNAILTAHFSCRFVFNHPYATLAAGLVRTLPPRGCPPQLKI